MTALMRLRERRKSDLDQSILDAAERVVGRSGMQGATMQEVAREAGVAVGTLYNHFGDRERLLGMLVLRHRQELAETLERALSRNQQAAFAEQARAFVSATVELFDRRRGFVRAALDSELWRGYADALGQASDDKPRVRAQLEATALLLVRDGLQRGALREHSAERLAAHLSGMLRGVLMMRARLDGVLLGADEEAELLVDLFLHGARARKKRT